MMQVVKENVKLRKRAYSLLKSLKTARNGISLKTMLKNKI